jgi:hypothetical protein
MDNFAGPFGKAEKCKVSFDSDLSETGRLFKRQSTFCFTVGTFSFQTDGKVVHLLTYDICQHYF